MDSDSLLRTIRSLGLDADFEVTCTSAVNSGLKIAGGAFNIALINETEAVGVRCICHGRMGLATASLGSKDALKIAIESAYKLAKQAGATDSQSGFSKMKIRDNQRRRGRMGQFKEENTIKEVRDAVQSISALKKVYSVNAFLDHSSKKVSIANSNGVVGAYESTTANILAEITAKYKGDQASGIKIQEARDYSGLDIPSTFKNAADTAVSLLGSKQAPTFRGQVLISPEAANGLVGDFIAAMSGEEVYKHRSFLKDKLGDKIASELLNITEDPSLPKSPYSRTFDDELIPTAKKDLVSNGVLKTYLHNIYSAEKMGVRSTGNAFRTSGGFVGATNLIIRRGEETMQDLLGRIDEGIYLLDTEDSPNMSTGDLSAMVSAGYYIKKGKIMYPVKETMIGINMIDLMRNISALSKEVFEISGISTPAILAKNVKISGK